MNRRDLFALTGIIASLILGISSAGGQTPGQYLQETSFEFGNVSQGDVLQHSFRLQNTGPSPVQIQIVGLNLPGMKVKAPQMVPPGGEGSLTVIWDTRSVRGDTAAKVVFRLDESEPAALTLSAKVVPPIDILPFPAVFISGFRDEEVLRTLEIVNNASVPLNINGLTQPDATPTFSASITTVETMRRYRLDVRLRVDAPSGRSQQVLQVLTDRPDSPVINVPVNVFLKDDVYVNPETVDFGEIAGRPGGPETFFLKKHRGPVSILSVESDLPYLKITHSADLGSSSHQFFVDLQETDAPTRRFSGNIYIKTDDPVFAEIIVPVQGEVHK